MSDATTWRMPYQARESAMRPATIRWSGGWDIERRRVIAELGATARCDGHLLAIEYDRLRKGWLP